MLGLSVQDFIHVVVLVTDSGGTVLLTSLANGCIWSQSIRLPICKLASCSILHINMPISKRCHTVTLHILITEYDKLQNLLC